ncbi:hypothetical protein B0T25DRAFT_523485 [Lasiosphaeria hispida]|uniref:Uncharacterized protein n=1 Tax=Lasiosphaeria hispida TaxID=260671 RepID=A0AAJ0H564_9PEZI|nr:hypothetical protein B0T25DRAFT_523485 [Lasiosphaeria hispida]
MAPARVFLPQYLLLLFGTIAQDSFPLANYHHKQSAAEVPITWHPLPLLFIANSDRPYPPLGARNRDIDRYLRRPILANVGLYGLSLSRLQLQLPNLPRLPLYRVPICRMAAALPLEGKPLETNDVIVFANGLDADGRRRLREYLETLVPPAAVPIPQPSQDIALQLMSQTQAPENETQAHERAPRRVDVLPGEVLKKLEVANAVWKWETRGPHPDETNEVWSDVSDEVAREIAAI